MCLASREVVQGLLEENAVREFKIGDRIVFYQTGTRFKGTVSNIEIPNELIIKSDDPGGIIYVVHAKQGRHLRVKPKPERKEARRVWIPPDSLGCLNRSIADGSNVYVRTRTTVHPDIEFREVLLNEVVVTREILAKAWDSEARKTGVADTHVSILFPLLCKALGLSEGDA